MGFYISAEPCNGFRFPFFFIFKLLPSYSVCKIQLHQLLPPTVWALSLAQLQTQHWSNQKDNKWLFVGYTFFFYKILGSGLIPQSCSYFQGFWGSKLLNVRLVVWPSNLCLRKMQYFSGFKTDIYDQWFQNFPNNPFETAEFWSVVSLTAILRLLQMKNSTFL